MLSDIMPARTEAVKISGRAGLSRNDEAHTSICCLEREAHRRWAAEDLGSTNGTRIKGQRLVKAAVLMWGDMLSLRRSGPTLPCDLPVPADPNATIRREDEFTPKATALESAHGNAERPYKVGKTPEDALRQERTAYELSAKGYAIVLGPEPDRRLRAAR